MKKFLTILLLLTVLLPVLFAFDIKDFNLNIVTIHPLYEPYAADSWNVQSRAQYIRLFNKEGLSYTLAFTRFEEGRESEYYKYDSIKPDQQEDVLYEMVPFLGKNETITSLFRVKTGFSFSALKLNYKDIVTAEFNIQGALNLVFNAVSGTDCIGFDGIYFYGLNAGFLDNMFSFRIGKHHYSGHYGDEIEESLMLLYDNQGRMYADRFAFEDSDPGYIARLIQYVRQDSLVIGLSAKPLSWLRVYGEFDVIPGKIHRFRPWVLNPQKTDCPGTGTTVEQYIGWSESAYIEEGDTRKFKYPSNYNAMSIETGVEFTFPVKDVVEVQLAADMKFFQEALTGYQVGAYDANNKWDTDFNILLSLSYKDVPVHAELIYHSGRFPLMNFFWNQCSYWSAGFSLSY